jgi:hypothetical protein
MQLAEANLSETDASVGHESENAARWDADSAMGCRRSPDFPEPWKAYCAAGIRMELAVQSRTAWQAVGCRFLARQNSTAER